MRKSKNGLPGAPGSVMWRIVAGGVLAQIAASGAVLALAVLFGRKVSVGSMVFATGALPWMLIAIGGANMAYKRGFAAGMKRTLTTE